MAESDIDLDPPMDEQSLRAMIDYFGGIEAMHERMALHHAAQLRLDNERATLVKTHPYKWVAMSGAGVLAFGDTLEDVVARISGRDRQKCQLVIEYLDPDPPLLVL